MSATPDEESWHRAVLAATFAEKARGSRVGADFKTVVELAETLAGTLARTAMQSAPELVNATVTILPGRAGGALTARVTTAPAFRGDGPTRELDTKVEIVNDENGLVGDAQFVWVAR